MGAKSKWLQNFICNNIIRFLSRIHIIKNHKDTAIKISRSLENFRNELGILQRNKTVLIKSSIINLFKLIIMYSIPFLLLKLYTWMLQFLNYQILLVFAHLFI